MNGLSDSFSGEETPTMIIGAHIMVQSMNDAADKAFLTKVLKLKSVDAGGGFLIFGVPPAEVAIHESDQNGMHELFFMVEDIEDFIEMMEENDIAYTPPANRGWGTLTEVTLPGGGKLGVYEPHHKRPKHAAPKAAARKAAAKKPAKKKTAAKKSAKKMKARGKKKTR
jgi:hypothetical protein